VRRLWALAFLALAAEARAAPSENLVAGLSQDQIQITSNYNGAEIVVFGAVERPQAGPRPDIVVVVRGPATDIRVRRKERIAGIWINTDRALLRQMPGYYFAAGTRLLGAVAPRERLRQYQLGIDRVEPRDLTAGADAEPFRRALIRQQERRGLYRQVDGGVVFLSGTLFRVRVPLPASAPRGRYDVMVYLLRDGQVIAAQSTPLDIEQIGLERRVFEFARYRPLAYGLSAVAMAVSLGWLSALVFRRAD
jgi:uncharacterized protein (TIGR02186 family)